MTQIKIFNNKVAFDGHADTKQECETVTLMCNNLAESKTFNTVKYENGYAEFEKVGESQTLKFAPSLTTYAMVFDSHVTKVSATDNYSQTFEWTTSGQITDSMYAFNGVAQVFNVTLQDGYIINTVTSDETGSSISIAPDGTSFITKLLGENADSGTVTVTITSKKKETIMSEKQINTRIKLKYDTLANWTKNDPVLLQGELAIATIPTAAPANKQLPPVMFKVGDGASKFSELDWASALAADVYGWAKAAARPAYKYGDADLTGFGTAAAKNVGDFDKAGAAANAETNAKAYVDEKIDALPAAAEYTLETGTTDGSLILKKDGVAVGDPAVVAGWAELLAKAEKGITDAAAAKDAADAKYTKPAGGIPKTDLAAAVQTSLGKADSALQSHQAVTLASGTNNGTLKLTVGGTATDNIAVKGLGSAAYTASSAYATAAQGTKADNALPAATFNTFKTENTAAIADAKKAGTDASAALETYKTSNDAKVSKNATDIANLQTAMKSGITFKGKLDSKPATTDYVNGDLIIVGAKEYILYDSGTAKEWIELGDEGSHLTKATADGYYVAKNADITGATKAKITYDSKGLVTGGADLAASDIPNLPASKITSGTLADARIASAATWNAKQDALSAEQLAAANSGITEAKVADYDAYATAISNKQDKLSAVQVNAINSGITEAKVADYDAYATAIGNKQDTAINLTGITAKTVEGALTEINTLAGTKQTASQVSSAISTELARHKGIDKVGTVTSVAAGTGLKVTGTSSVSPTIEIDEAVTFIFDCGSSSVNI